MLPLRLAPLWLAVGWLGVGAALYASLLPGGLPLPATLWDKLQHALGYAALTLWFTGIYPRERYRAIGAACFGLGLAIELLQAATATRTPEVGDVVANAVGIAAALAVARLALGGWAARVERAAGLA